MVEPERQVKDELAERRAAKAILTVKISAGTTWFVDTVAIDPGRTRDPIAVLKARARKPVSR